MSSSSDVVWMTKEELAEAKEEVTWGTPPRIYLSYGMVAMKGMRPVLTDAVEATQSVTVLSPPMGLDFFAVLDGRGLVGVAGAAGEPERLLGLLRDALAAQVFLDLCRDSPQYFQHLDGTSRDGVVGWWSTMMREAFRAFRGEVAACSQGEPGVDAPAAATAIVALVHETYLVVGNCGTSKAVLSRSGELVELRSDSEHMAIRRGDENKSVETSKLATAPGTTTGASAGSSAAAAAATGGVDVVVVEREAQDEFLIIGSAALWDKVTPAEACAHVRRRLTSRVTMRWEPRRDAEGSATLLAKELARMALSAGSRDNVSVVLVVFRDLRARQTVRGPLERRNFTKIAQEFYRNQFSFTEKNTGT